MLIVYGFRLTKMMAWIALPKVRKSLKKDFVYEMPSDWTKLNF